MLDRVYSSLLSRIQGRNRVLERLGVDRIDKLLRELLFLVSRFFHSTFFLRLFPLERRIIQKTLKINGSIFVDVGANVGFYSILLHKNFENIISIEPYRENMLALRRHAKSLGINNIRYVEKAISNENSVAPFYIYKHEGEHSLLIRPSDKILSQAPPEKSIMIETTTLDLILKEYKRIDLIKVDVEGAEWEVLEGSSLIMNSVKNWIIELHARNRERRREWERFFMNNDFAVRWLDHTHILATNKRKI